MAEASNSPEEQRSEGDSKPGKPRQSAKQENYRWWSVFLGIPLFVLNVGFLFQGLYLNILLDNFELLWLLYFLIGFLCFFLVGGIRGWVTGHSGSSLRLGRFAMLTGMIPVILLCEAIGFFITPIGSFRAISDFILAIMGHPQLDDVAGLEFIAFGIT